MNKKGSNSLPATILQLGKIKISIAVALTGFLGYIRASDSIGIDLIFVIFGILFLAMGSSTFNQVQEREIDRKMQRTMNRPLPSGRISVKNAVIVGLLLSIAGTFLLYLTGSRTTVIIGIFTLLWYNFVYTPLKKVTPFAVLPGAIIGALPPIIGWTAAGGALLDHEIILISFFLFIGQMPHYWLLLMKVGNEFANAQLPVITKVFSEKQLRNISFIWVLAAGVSVASFPALGIISSNALSFSMIGLMMLFLLRMFWLSFKGEIMTNWKKAFITVNAFYLLIILLLIADKLSVMYLY